MQKSQDHIDRNAHKYSELSPKQRFRICELIRRELELEASNGKTAGREFWCRVAIGLPPRPQPISWERH
jgi:hypothetical protein